jgi:hypothetical protein
MSLAGCRLALAAVLCCVACAGHTADSASAVVVPLVNSGFEQPAVADQPIPGWDTPVHADAHAYAFALDAKVHHRGSASARITRTGHEPWGMISQALATPALRGHTLELSAWMRTGNADGAGAMLVMRTMAHGAVDQHVFQDPPVTATTPWTRYSVRLAIPAGSTSVVEIGAMLQGGGTLWVDDVALVMLR